MTPAEITCIVGNILGVSPGDITQDSHRDRSDRVVFARCAAITLCKEKTSSSLITIAKNFNLKNHATVLNSLRTCYNMIDTNRVFRELFKLIEININKTEFERLQLTEFIPFVYSLETTENE